MIRINLLPVREARRKADVQQQAVLLGAALGASLLIAGLIHWNTQRQISGAGERIAQMQQQIEEFKPQLTRVEEYRAKKADIEKKLGVIRSLDRSRSGPVHVLDEIATHAPQRLWLTELIASKGLIKLKGMSLDNEVIAVFLTALNDSPYFDAVELRETKLSERDGLKLNSFEMQARLTSPEEEAAKAAGGTASTPAATPTTVAAQAKK
jgi:type IV pilus assembly protein PilN